jgi:hypothetical protein
MKVKDAGELIFTCTKDEKATMSITCDNTLFGINYTFKPAVPNTFVEDQDSGVIKFTVARDTDLIINFNYSQQVGGVYQCGIEEVDDFPDKTFPDTVRQFGPLPQRRTYTFLLG